jgi:hypothetical protein
MHICSAISISSNPVQADHLLELEQAHRLLEAEAAGLRAEASKLNKQLQV